MGLDGYKSTQSLTGSEGDVAQAPAEGQNRPHRVRILGRRTFLYVTGTPDERIAAIAADQRGRVARRQLLAAGISQRMLAVRLSHGWLYQLYAGVYAVGHLAPVELGAETAALLAVSLDAVLSHYTAAVLWRLRPPVCGAAIHVSVPSTSGSSRRPGICTHRTGTLLPRDIRVRDGLPVTSAARALLDIAGDTTLRELELALDEGLRSGVLTRGQVRDVLGRIPNRRGERRLRELVEPNGQTTVTRSEAEERFLALIRDAQLPDPSVNVRLEGFTVDFLWRRERIVVEVDGYRYHGSRRRFEEDRAKGAVLAAAGFQVIRVTWRQMEDEPYAVIARLAQALARAQTRAA
ncbi:MAG: hypothetical protein QOD66_2801 [Solirubrobacteraceae bacterium]|nr:hypothetical protein [Solirubrobacteraceae bacterium]